MTASTGNVPARIFMTYRRADTAYPAAWLFDRLASHFGRDQIFKDIDSIELGDDFVEVINAAVGSCDVLLALIGDRWLTIADRDGRRRLDDPGDYVRLEIEAALARDVRVIPILVEGAQMPRADELPASLAKLARRHALELSSARFDADTQRLLRVLDRTIAAAQEQARQQAEQAAAEHRRQVEQLQGRLRDRAAVQDWDAVVAASDELAGLDTAAADPDGLASTAREQITRRQEAGHTTAAAQPADDQLTETGESPRVTAGGQADTGPVGGPAQSPGGVEHRAAAKAGNDHPPPVADISGPGAGEETTPALGLRPAGHAPARSDAGTAAHEDSDSRHSASPQRDRTPEAAGGPEPGLGKKPPRELRAGRGSRPRAMIIATAVGVAIAGLVIAITMLSDGGGTPGTSAHGSGTSSSAGVGASSRATGSAAGGLLSCLVSDTGGIHDRSFNASAWAGMQAAHVANSSINVKYLQSTTPSDYVTNISAFIDEKCKIIVTEGFGMSDATKASAQANSSQKFAIVDFSYSPTLRNVQGLVFNTVQNGFLGGYLAAGMTKTGKVATFGGENLPTVTIYMDGFWDGVQYYNSKHGTHVQVLGWNEQTQNGSFTGDFTNQTKGQTLTETFISEGADIIFPVAGNVGLGAAKAVEDADNAAGSQKVNMMWVDLDGCVSVPQYCKYFITSVEKGIVEAVKTAVLAAASGSFKGGNYVGTLANGGVALAPYHDFTAKVPASLQSELAQVKADIVNGSIQTPTNSPV